MKQLRRLNRTRCCDSMDGKRSMMCLAFEFKLPLHSLAGTEVAFEASAGVGAFLILTGTLAYGYGELASGIVQWMIGSASFVIAGCFLSYRHFCVLDRPLLNVL